MKRFHLNNSLVLSILIICCSGPLYGQSSNGKMQNPAPVKEKNATRVTKSKFRYFKYVLPEDQSFGDIVKKFVNLNSVINAKTPMVKKMRLLNKNIKDWNNIPKGTLFLVVVSEDYMNPQKVKKMEEEGIVTKLDTTLKKPNETLLPAPKKVGFNASVFYMASKGNFSQTTDTESAKINFSQNSQLSLGLVGSYDLKNHPFAISSSLYFSSLVTPDTGTGAGADIPSEVGANCYIQHMLEKYNFTYSAGIDFETFTTFDSQELIQSSTLKVVDNNIFYLTFGFSSIFKVWKRPMLGKLSFSQSLFSSSSLVSESSNISYVGLKTLLYLNYNVYKSWFIHGLFKLHTMQGIDNLSVSRIGIGFGYNFN